MLPTNFATLASEYPDLSLVWKRLAAWVQSHPNRKMIDPKTLARNMRDVPPQVLLEAFHVMVQHGMLRQAFAVESSNGQLLSGLYDSPLDVPEKVRGSFEEWIDTDDARVVPVFVEEGAGE